MQAPDLSGLSLLRIVYWVRNKSYHNMKILQSILVGLGSGQSLCVGK